MSDKHDVFREDPPGLPVYGHDGGGGDD